MLGSDESALKDLLKKGEVIVTFTKADGSNRVMKCTTNASLMPALPATEAQGDTKKRKAYVGVQAVYDLEAGGFRSFRFDSVTRFQA